MVFQGALNKERFLEYLRDYLVPTLQESDIVIMDNLGFHKVSGVAGLIHSAVSASYSPCFNPIEKMRSKLKTYFRKLKIRSLDLLWDAIPNAFALVSASVMPLDGFMLLDTANVFTDCSNMYRYISFSLTKGIRKRGFRPHSCTTPRRVSKHKSSQKMSISQTGTHSISW